MGKRCPGEHVICDCAISRLSCFCRYPSPLPSCSISPLTTPTPPSHGLVSPPSPEALGRSWSRECQQRSHLWANLPGCAPPFPPTHAQGNTPTPFSPGDAPGGLPSLHIRPLPHTGQGAPPTVAQGTARGGRRDDTRGPRDGEAPALMA